MSRTCAGRGRGVVSCVIHRIADPFCQSFQHRDVDFRAFARFSTLNERSEDVGVSIHASGDIGDGNACLAGVRIGACDR